MRSALASSPALASDLLAVAIVTTRDPWNPSDTHGAPWCQPTWVGKVPGQEGEVKPQAVLAALAPQTHKGPGRNS